MFTGAQVDYGEPEDLSASEGGHRTFSLSPLAHKMKSPPMSQRRAIGPQVIVEQRPFVPDLSPLPSDIEEAQETEAEDDVSSLAPSGVAESVCFEDDMAGSDEESYTESEEDEKEWEPPNKTPKAKRHVVTSPSPSPEEKTKVTSTATPRTPWASKLVQDMEYLHLDDSAVILPRRSKGHSTAVKDDGDIPVKKKKRLVFSPTCIAS